MRKKYALVPLVEVQKHLDEGWAPVVDNDGRPCTASNGGWAYTGVSSGPTTYVWLVALEAGE
jgi:hypothetical protein